MIADPRPQPNRLPQDVPLTIVGDADLAEFGSALASAQACAIDTETVYSKTDPSYSIGALRVVSAATRNAEGVDHSWVVDVRNINTAKLAAALSGVRADAWNANFDSHVIERDLFDQVAESATGLTGLAAGLTPPVWWDVMLADALLHQGLSGFDFYHSLAWATEWYLGLRAQGKGTTQISFTADGELSEEQLQYAAADAVETMWVGQIARTRLAEAELEKICELEQSARPFLAQMQRTGLAVNQAGWRAELQTLEKRRDELLTRLAELTGGGQAGLFDAQLKPSWNPNSEYDVRNVLNEHEIDRVKLWTEQEFNVPRLLDVTDSMGAMALSAIGGEICTTLLAFREATKILSTYGEGLLSSLHPDGRFHSSYLQVVGTNTGRLASRNPNAQNLTPRLKPYIVPAPGCVFVYADLSQAELRFAAQIAGDKKLQEAFELGLDVHDSTATNMFGIDMQKLRATDPAQHELMRTKAKRINFGILYGLRGAGLARTLTEDGVATQRHEADELISTYLTTYPGVGAWVAKRDEFVEALSNSPPPVDWPLTLQLHQLRQRVGETRQQLRAEMQRHYTVEEIAERLGAGIADAGAAAGSVASAMVDPVASTAVSPVEAAWCMSFSAAVVLGTDGKPIQIDSRTLAGRRQQFTVRTESVLATAAEIVGSSEKPEPAHAWNMALKKLGVAARRRADEHRIAAISKALENRQLRRAVVDAVGEVMGAEKQTLLLQRALGSRIGQLANAYRNAPIQGGVADIMLDAFALLHDRLGEIAGSNDGGARGVQTVHDSVVVECLEGDAEKVEAIVRDAMEEAMRNWCPDVPAVVDTDIRTSLSDKDVASRV